MPRTTDTKERMIAVSWELVNESGWDALNLHRIAERLGIKPPSLYNHIKSLDDLRSQLALAAHQGLSNTLLEATAGKEGVEAIRSMGSAYRAFILQNPGMIYALSHSAEYMSIEVKRESDRALSAGKQLLGGLNLGDDEQIHALRMVRSLVHGFVTLELSEGFGLPQDRDESFNWMLDRLVDGLRAG